MKPDRELLPSWEYQGIDLLYARYGTQFDHEKERGLFERLAWFNMLEQHCFAGDPPVVCHAAEGGAEALLLLHDEGTHLAAFANYYSFSFGALFLNGPDADARARLLTTIARDLRGRTGRISLCPVLDDAGMASLLVRAFRNAGWLAIKTDIAHNHVLRVRGRTFGDYWATRPSRLRKLVRRKGRGAPFSFDLHRQLSDALWADYMAVYAASWKPDEPYPAMVRAIAADAGTRGALRLAFARMPDGRPVATQLWTVEEDVALLHKIAHDASFDRHSPGTLLAHFMFGQVIDTDRVAMIDYGTGDNSYKREWMEEERPMFRIDCFDPLAPSMWLPAARGVISRLVGRKNGR